MPPIMLELIIYLKGNDHLWNNMDVVLAYRTAREDMSTRTKEKVSDDEEAYRVAEAQEDVIEYMYEGGNLVTYETWLV